MPTQTFLNLTEDKKNRIIDAAIEEFSQRSYETGNISNIIKAANISRGSFYQYFEDKKDLYIYLFHLMRDKKMAYLADTMAMIGQIPFLDLFSKMYREGVRFALSEPRLVNISKHLLHERGALFDEILGDGLQMAHTIYKQMIEKDKELGLIRQDVDSDTFAGLVVDMTLNVTLDNINFENMHFDEILDKVDKIIEIFRKGVE